MIIFSVHSVLTRKVKKNMFNYFVVFLCSTSAVFFIVQRFQPVVPLFLILIVSLGIRLFVSYIFISYTLSSDIASFITAGYVLQDKTPTYPWFYFPVFSYLGSIAIHFGTFVPPFLFLKIVFSLFDTGITYWIYRFSKNRVSALLYALNPISLMVFCVHGQIDALPLFFMFTSIFFAEKYNTIAALLFGIAVAVKPWPIIFLPVMLKKSKFPFSYVLVGLVPLFVTFIYSLQTQLPMLSILTPIKNYRGIYGIWGIVGILFMFSPQFVESSMQLFRKAFFLFFGIFEFVPRKGRLIQEFFYVLLLFFVFTPTFGAQWLTWITPFLFIFQPALWIWAIVSIGLVIWSSLTPVPFFWRESLVTASSLFTWLVFIRMFLLYRKSRAQN